MKLRVRVSIFIGIFFCWPFYGTAYVENEGFGGSSISKSLFDHIRSVLPDGAIILEFGSGWATGQLALHYTMLSVEHDVCWLNKYPSSYIYAPIKNGWYDIDTVKREVENKAYDLILVDRPPAWDGKLSRMGFFDNLDIFDASVMIIIDDVHRETEHDLLCKVANKLKRSFVAYNDDAGKAFGVIGAQDRNFKNE